MCRIQNASLVSESFGEVPVADLSSLFHKSLEPNRPSELVDSSADKESGEADHFCDCLKIIVVYVLPAQVMSKQATK